MVCMILQVLSLSFLQVFWQLESLQDFKFYRVVQLRSYSKFSEKCLGYFDHHPKDSETKDISFESQWSFRIRKEIGRGIILRVAMPNLLKKHYFY